ncbi:MAG: T9SS type A sorting domain-containing protein [Cyclobacteriaceae bacterium]|nr:T9SS type A sorting domain-containing protein [Cyclobacteriaceae bacterium]
MSRPTGFTGCQITWSATNGKVESQNGATATIKWNDTPGATGTVTATFSNCGNSNDGKTASKSELILSVKNQSWGSYGTSVNVDYCTKAQVYLSVPRMFVQGTGGIAQPPQVEVAYAWTLPSGWKEVGTGRTGFFGTSTNFIAIEPIDCSKPGNVTVYGTLVGAGPFCNSAEKSATATISLNGANPVVTVGPQPGFNGITACYTTPVTFTATLNAALGCVNSYNWTFPPSWTEISSTPNTITLQPSGTPADAGNIRATVSFACGSSIQSANYVPPYIPPVITGPNLVCDSESYAIQNADGLTVTWSSSNTNIATVNSSGVVTRVGNASGEVIITATLPCAAPPATKAVWVGLTQYLYFSASYQSQGIMLSTPYVGGGVTAQWSVNGMLHAGFDAFVQPQCIDYTNIPLEISLTVANQCESKTVCTQYMLKCPPSPVLTNMGSCEGGGGGEEPEFHEEYQYSVSPNPANRIVSIAVIPGLGSHKTSVPSASTPENIRTIQSVVLTDMNGQVKYTREFSSVTKQAELDVSGLKKGVYVLKISSGKNVEIHRVVIK